MTVPFPESEVAQVVEDVVQNGIIRGTKEYNKDEFVAGAIPVRSTKVFGEKPEAGTAVFYKVRLKALDPRNFKNSGDLGTLAVRYAIKAQNETNTTIRIDARFVEDFRHTVHPSNGSVESEEYKDIHDQLEELGLAKDQALEAKRINDAEREQKEQKAGQGQSTSQQQSAGASSSAPSPVMADLTTAATTRETSPPATADIPSLSNAQAGTLEERVHELRSQTERKVKAPGAPLKSAPFHTASNLQSLPEGTEVLILISTTYWFGVETHDGQHGWMLRDELEPVQ